MKTFTFQSSMSTLLILAAVGCGSGGQSGRVFSDPAKKAAGQPSQAAETNDQNNDKNKAEQPIQGPAQEVDGQPDPRLQDYNTNEWPAASSARTGVAFLDISTPGWARTDYQVDPRLGQATLTFAVELGAELESQPQELKELQGPKASVFVTVRLHETAQEARQNLLRKLLAATRKLKPAAGYGDVAYSVKAGKALNYLAAVRGNVCFTVRAADAGIDASVIASATDKFISSSPKPGKLDPTKAAPRASFVAAGEAKTGQPIVLELQSNQKLEFMAFECSPRSSASVVRNGEHYELYSGEAGQVTIKAFACSASLRRMVFESQVTVTKGW